MDDVGRTFPWHTCISGTCVSFTIFFTKIQENTRLLSSTIPKSLLSTMGRSKRHGRKRKGGGREGERAGSRDESGNPVEKTAGGSGNDGQPQVRVEHNFHSLREVRKR